MALVLQSVLEREVRKTMSEETIDLKPVYPEHRLSAHPTTARIGTDYRTYRYNAFIMETLSSSNKGGLTTLRHKVLDLMGMSECDLTIGRR